MALSSQHRVYIPTIARANHYLLAEFKPNDTFYAQFSDLNSCYDRISRQLFALCDEYELHNVHVIANDKLPVVRFHEEAYCLETDKQILFFYNPQYHEAHRCFIDKHKQSKKVRLLFLATGDDLRANAAIFHNQVKKVIDELQSSIFNDTPVKLRDHQHLTYDLFAKAKGHKQSYGYKLRSLYPRYKSRQCLIPDEHNEMTYATFSLPITRSLKTQFQHLLNIHQYTVFYEFFYTQFLQQCRSKELTLGAMIANGTMPIVRNSKIDNTDGNNEWQKLSFNQNSQKEQFSHYWEDNMLVENLHFIIVANQLDQHDMGFGRFMNQVESVINGITADLAINAKRQDLTVRFFQHISY
ncbi:MAG: DUF3083 family protein [Pseudoalteromonas sp.]|uniref:DUF3083 family protein n=1 Tax=unclassified Pseudoalteromonas TaxID=194690 RepID=UPI003F9E68B6